MESQLRNKKIRLFDFSSSLLIAGVFSVASFPRYLLSSVNY
jgi:hypothetical protein